MRRGADIPVPGEDMSVVRLNPSGASRPEDALSVLCERLAAEGAQHPTGVLLVTWDGDGAITYGHYGHTRGSLMAFVGALLLRWSTEGA